MRTVTARCPLRVSYLGGGTDLPKYLLESPSYILGGSINKYIYVTVSEKQFYDYKYVLHYRKIETVNTIEEIQHDIIREVLRHFTKHYVGMPTALEIHVTADIPSKGSGLGSSSAFCNALICALFRICNFSIFASKEDIASLSCQIEIEVLGKNIGIQDQYLTALGGFNYLMLVLKQARLSHYLYATLPNLIDEKYLKEDRKTLEENTKLFYLPRKDLAEKVISTNQSKDNYDNSIKVIKETALRFAVNRKYNFSQSNIFEDCRESWFEKNKYETDPILSNFSNSSVIGKFCGAGNGGFLLVFSNPNREKEIPEILENYEEMPFKFEDEGVKVIYDSSK